jgi:hypothetical protein
MSSRPAIASADAKRQHEGNRYWLGPARDEGQGMMSTDVPSSGEHPVDLRAAELQMPGELIYEYAPLVTDIVEYGTSADAMFAGETPPPEGARLDLTLEGPIGGPKLNGTVKGKDYLCFRADGKAELHIHAEITTDDGKKIALFADGVAIGQQGSPVFRLRENVTLTTSESDFAWLNSLQIWGVGTVDVSTGQVDLKGYAV